jgi:23S rRNA pseudouridine2605 synthase
MRRKSTHTRSGSHEPAVARARTCERTLVLVYHKPKGVITSRKDEHGRDTVFDRLLPLLPARLHGLDWHPVGRLDKDTTGLLLFTNDGAFVHFATHPETGLRKRYRVLAKGLLTPAQIAALERGVPLTGGLGTSAPATVALIAHNIGTSWITVEVREGKNREVRRMLLAVGSQAIRLHREALEGLELDVDEGDWRELSLDEIRYKLHYEPSGISTRSRLRSRPRRDAGRNG